MAAFIAGGLTINTVGGSSNVNFGGAVFITPKNISKSFLGSGAGHTSVLTFSITGPSSTNTVDVDLADQILVLDN